MRTVASLVVSALLVYLMFGLLQPFLIPLATGGVIALLSRPLFTRAQRLFRSTEFSALITILFFVIIVLVPIVIIGALVVREIMGLSWTVHNPSYSFNTLNHMFDPILNRVGISPANLHIDIKLYLVEALKFVGDRSTMVIGGVLGALASLVLTFLSAFYIICSHDKIRHIARSYSPLNPDDTMLLWDRTKEVIRATVKGNLILIVIEAVLAMIGFAVFGIVSPVVLGLCFGLASMVPAVGAALIWVPVVIFEVLQGNWIAAIGIGLWSWAQVALCDYYIGPHLIEKRAQLHPFIVLLGILGGVAQFGVLGIILGPTIMAVGIVGLDIARKTWQIRPD